MLAFPDVFAEEFIRCLLRLSPEEVEWDCRAFALSPNLRSDGDEKPPLENVCTPALCVNQEATSNGLTSIATDRIRDNQVSRTNDIPNPIPLPSHNTHEVCTSFSLFYSRARSPTHVPMCIAKWLGIPNCSREGKNEENTGHTPSQTASLPQKRLRDHSNSDRCCKRYRFRLHTAPPISFPEHIIDVLTTSCSKVHHAHAPGSSMYGILFYRRPSKHASYRMTLQDVARLSSISTRSHAAYSFCRLSRATDALGLFFSTRESAESLLDMIIKGSVHQNCIGHISYTDVLTEENVSNNQLNLVGQTSSEDNKNSNVDRDSVEANFVKMLWDRIITGVELDLTRFQQIVFTSQVSVTDL